MQAYDKKRRRVVNVERSEGDVIVAYSLPGEPGIWYFKEIYEGDIVELTNTYFIRLCIE